MTPRNPVPNSATGGTPPTLETRIAGCRGALYAKAWVATCAAPRGVVVVVHGLGEHSGRYDPVARRLAAAGWSTLAYDQQGHGRSPGRRGCVASYDALLRDVDAACRAARDLLGGGPPVLLGHSMGANIAANYALRRCAPLAALVLSGPLFLPTYPPPAAILYAGWLAGSLLPWIRMRAPVVAEQLTADPAEQRSAAADPLRHRWMSMYLITRLLLRGRWALQHARQLRTPTLLLHGGADALADPQGSETFALRAGTRATLIRYDAMRHEVFHETDREQVFADLLDWLARRPRQD